MGDEVTEEDRWTYRVPRTPEQLAEERRASLEWWGGADQPFTCDGCPRASVCVLAFDPYNTHGDCLYDK